jgi:hypothetical protein
LLTPWVAAKQSADDRVRETCGDPASRPCREFVEFGIINGAPCDALNRSLDAAKDAMEEARQGAKERTGWEHVEAEIKEHCP